MSTLNNPALNELGQALQKAGRYAREDYENKHRQHDELRGKAALMYTTHAEAKTQMSADELTTYKAILADVARLGEELAEMKAQADLYATPTLDNAMALANKQALGNPYKDLKAVPDARHNADGKAALHPALIFEQFLRERGVNAATFSNPGTAPMFKMSFAWGEKFEEVSKSGGYTMVKSANDVAALAGLNLDEAPDMKSFISTHPNMPSGYMFGGAAPGTEGYLGALCGLYVHPSSCARQRPQSCLQDIATVKSLPGTNRIWFERTELPVGNFTTVCEPYETQPGGGIVRNPNKPFLGISSYTLEVPMHEFAGLTTMSERSLQVCPERVLKLLEAFESQFVFDKNTQYQQGNGAVGANPQILGLLNQAGITNITHGVGPYGTGTDTLFDSVAIAIQVARLNGCVPDAVYVNNINYLRAKLRKDTTGRPIYDFQDCVTGEIHCLKVCDDPTLPLGVMIVGKFKDNVHLVDDGRVTVSMGWINDDFRQNKRRVRWEQQIGLYVCAPWCLVRVNAIP